MNVDEVNEVENDDHLVYGTVTWVKDGDIVIRADHVEHVPRFGQRVKVLPAEIADNEGTTDA